MAINRKGKRSITVEGNTFLWNFFHNGAQIFQENPFGEIRVDYGYVPSIEDHGDVTLVDPSHSPMRSITPKHISEAILFARQSGWRGGPISIMYKNGQFEIS